MVDEPGNRPDNRLIHKKEDWAREKRGLTPQAREEGVSVRQNPTASGTEKPGLPPANTW
jgi:hypothetical protein